MFGVNDKVILKRGGVFWMTVKSINPSGWISCNFGGSENFAGRFKASELSFYFED